MNCNCTYFCFKEAAPAAMHCVLVPPLAMLSFRVSLTEVCSLWRGSWHLCLRVAYITARKQFLWMYTINWL